MVETLLKKDTPAELFQTPPALAEHLKATVKVGDIIVVIGAGAVTEVANELTN
jgi:UDP-N-acetylmuramate-alanine ligase